MEETIKEISNLIGWYLKNSPSEAANIDKLLRFQDKLSGYTFFIQTELSIYQGNYNKTYARRKNTFAMNKMKYIETLKLTAAHAETKAESDVKDIREEEVLNYNIGSRLDNIVRSADRILKVCQQRISWLKMESEQTKKQV